MDLDYKLIGYRIRQQRKNFKMTQESLAEVVNVGTTHISHIETGNSIPSLKVFIKIINILNLSADEVIGIQITSDNKTNNNISSALSNCTDKELIFLKNTLESVRTLLTGTK